MNIIIDIDELYDILTDVDLYPVSSEMNTEEGTIKVQGTDNEGNPINYTVTFREV